jgi:hypothetical protein
VVVLGFNSADDPGMAKEFMKECGFTFRTVLDSGPEAINVAFSGYKASCVPLHYLIDRQGKIALTQPGFETGYTRILGTLARLGIDTGVAPLPLPKAARKVREAEKSIPSVGSSIRGEAEISGSVLDAAGKPVKDVSVRLLCKDPAVRKAAATDEEGRFIFRRLPAGAYTVTVEWDPLDEAKDRDKEIKIDDGRKVEMVFTRGSNGAKIE